MAFRDWKFRNKVITVAATALAVLTAKELADIDQTTYEGANARVLGEKTTDAAFWIGGVIDDLAGGIATSVHEHLDRSAPTPIPSKPANWVSPASLVREVRGLEAPDPGTPVIRL